MKKLLITLFFVFILIISALIAIPILYKNKIKEIVLTEVNKKINGEIALTDFRMSFFKHFPSLSCQLDGFTISGIDSFANDTLLSAKSIAFKLSLLPLVTNNDIKIKYLTLDNATINAIRLASGKANWDILPIDTTVSQTDTATAKFAFAINGYQINNSNIIFDDRTIGFSTTLRGLNHSGSGDFTQDDFVLKTKTNIEQLSITYGLIEYLSKVKVKLEMPIAVNLPNFSFAFEQSEAIINELKIALVGNISMPSDDITMDLAFEAPQNEFKNLLSLIPGAYTSEFKDVQAGGNFSLKALLKGTYSNNSLPTFDFNLLVNNGFFQYPSLPERVKDIAIDLQVVNKTGELDATIIHLKKMSLLMGNNPINANLLMRNPITTTFLDGELKAKLDLDNIRNYFPQPDGHQLNGKIDADLKFNGELLAITNKAVDKFFFKGYFGLQEFFYKSKDYPQGININKAFLEFNPQLVNLENFDAKFGTSDIKAKGKLENLLFYFFKDEPLKGSLFVKSGTLNLNEWLTDTSIPTDSNQQAVESSALKAIAVPSNLNLAVNAQVDRVFYDNMELTNVSGALLVHDQILEMRDLTMGLLGGDLQASGFYSTANGTNAPAINFQLGMVNFDIQKSVQTFHTMQNMVPISKFAQGLFSTNFSISGNLKNDMLPNLNTLSGGGLFKLNQGSLSGFEPLNKLSSLLQMEQLKRADFKDLRLAFEFEDGRLFVAPFKTQLANIPVTVAGSNGFDQSISYNLDFLIPRNKMGATNTAITSLLNEANKLGVKYEQNQNIPVGVEITGTITNPIIKTNLKDLANSAANSLIDGAKDELKKQKDLLEKQARDEAEKLKNSALEKKKELQDQGKAEAEKLKAEAEKQRKAIEEEARRKQREVEEEAKRRADSLKKAAEEAAKRRLRDLIPR